MSRRKDGWGCLLSIIVASVLLIIIIPKGKNTDTSGTNKNNHWYKSRVEYEKTKKDLEKIKLQQVELQNDVKQYQSLPNTIHKSNPDNAYSEGYDEGFEHGNYDGRNGYSHGYSFDDSSCYNDYNETRYQEGYSNGYEEGYSDGKSSYEEEHDDEFDD